MKKKLSTLWFFTALMGVLFTYVAQAEPRRAAYQSFNDLLIDWEFDQKRNHEDYYGNYLTAFRNIGRQFYGICGDTFCEGDYPNLELRDNECTVAAGSETMKSCLFLFHGLYTSVNPLDGSIDFEEKTYACRLEFEGQKASLWYEFVKLVGAAGDDYQNGIMNDALKIPGANVNFYDFFGHCLNGQ